MGEVHLRRCSVTYAHLALIQKRGEDAGRERDNERTTTTATTTEEEKKETLNFALVKIYSKF